MTLVDDFFEPWEQEISSFDEINAVLTGLFERWVSQGRRFAWRGAVSASWPLHSSLYRRLLWTRETVKAPTEPTLQREEGELLKKVHRWGLHHGSTGRLSILAQLATLQHFGAPTRLIDVTMNAYVGLWFAVEHKLEGGEIGFENEDGRLFAIDITDRLINEDDHRRGWEDRTSRPWTELDQQEWSTQTWAWDPPAFQARIASQHGAFLLGGVPRSGVVVWPKGSSAGGGNWHMDDVRRCVSVAIRMHKAAPQAGGVSSKGQPAYTFRIKASAKQDIRERLEQLFAYSHQVIYPDYPGFAQFASGHLRTVPPETNARAD